MDTQEEVVETQETATDTENAGVSEETTEIKDAKAVLAALDRAKSEAKTFREERDALKERIAALEADDTVSLWKQKAITAYVNASLKDRGVKDTARVMKYLSLEGVDLADDDTLVGFEEKVEALKKDLPELFDVKRQVASADIFADSGAKVKRSGTELQVQRIFNRA